MSKRAKLTDNLTQFAATKRAPAAADSASDGPALGDAPGKAMTLRLDLATWRALKLRAIDEGRPAHKLVLEAVRAYLAKPPGE